MVKETLELVDYPRGLIYVRYDAVLKHLPTAFPHVIAVDTIEHMPQERRQDFVTELFRVASKKVVVSCPFYHRGNIKGEKSLIRKMMAQGIKPKSSLVEHQKYGLPKKSELTAIAWKINPRRFALYPETKRHANLRLLRIQIGMDKNDQSF